MAHFQVYKDEDGVENRQEKVRETKLFKSKVSRIALGEINVNTVVGTKASNLNVKHSNVQEASDALKQIKLCKKDDNKDRIQEENRTNVLQVPPPSLQDDADSSVSSISLDVSLSEAEKYNDLYSIKAYTESLYDCLTYRDDIYKYLCDLETKRKPKAFYMKKQPHITYAMRSTLVDWLVEVTEEYNLHEETLFLAISIVDRFLSVMAVVSSKLQLLGTSAMFIAAKYEEVYAPGVHDLTYITDNTYTNNQVLKMEQLIMKTLDFNVSVPTPHTFVSLFSKVASIEPNVSALAIYTCELCLMEGDPYLQFPPSLLACSSLAFARHCFNYGDVWPAILAKISGYSLQRHLSKVFPYINQTHKNAPNSNLTASRKKYQTSRNYGVSLIPLKPINVKKKVCV